MTPMIFWGSLAVTLTVGVAMGIAIARYRASASESQEHAARALVMRHELRRALDRDEFVLHYQPTIELGTDLVSCLEALVRWQHPERGLLMPSQFLSVAEQDFELMGSLTSWVLRRALADHVAWTKAGHDWAVAVNISAPDLGSLEFADTVGQILAEAGVRPDRLHLEVESVWSHPRLRQDLANGVGELQRPQVWGGDVNRNRPVVAGLCPGLSLIH